MAGYSDVRSMTRTTTLIVAPKRAAKNPDRNGKRLSRSRHELERQIYNEGFVAVCEIDSIIFIQTLTTLYVMHGSYALTDVGQQARGIREGTRERRRFGKRATDTPSPELVRRRAGKGRLIAARQAQLTTCTSS